MSYYAPPTSRQREHGKPRVRIAPSRNAMNPTIGSRMQQACESLAEKPGEVVRNHKVGTRCSRRDPRARSEGGNVNAGVDAREDVDGGEDERGFAPMSRQRCRGGQQDPDESHERWSMNSTGTQERELWRRAKLERAGFMKVMATSSARNAVEGRKPSRVRQVTGKTGEGSGEVQRPATTSALTRRTTL